jgi:hypothetical protein
MSQSCQQFGTPTQPNRPSRSAFQVAAIGVSWALQTHFTGAALAAALLTSPALTFTAMAATPTPATPLTHVRPVANYSPLNSAKQRSGTRSDRIRFAGASVSAYPIDMPQKSIRSDGNSRKARSVIGYAAQHS